MNSVLQPDNRTGPGLFLHMGNRLETLASELARTLQKPLSSVFAPEIILVQSRGMARWVSMALAGEDGVFANGDFPFPNAFVDALCTRLFPDMPPTEETVFSPTALAFRITALLPECIALPGFEQLRGYLEDDTDKRKRLQLAEKIADLYDQYLVFRPDMVFAWEAGTEAHWQAKLWRRLANGQEGEGPGAAHRARRHRKLIRMLQDLTVPVAGLPERVSVFGISYLPPFHLEVLASLARRIPVHLFFVNPCWEYWADIAGRREMHRAYRRYPHPELDPESDLHLEEGNRILAATGTLGRDFLQLVSGTDARQQEHFDDPGSDRLLFRVQSDILHLTNPAAPAGPAPDRSIQIHACHSAMREIEVLYDQLLAIFEEIPDLQPRDVLVMTPDIESIAPLVHAVFGAQTDERLRIPYSVADRGSRSESPIAAGLLSLMGLVGGRLPATEVLSLLEISALRRRFGIAETETSLIERWVTQCGIRWGKDAQSRAGFGLPPVVENSWHAGIDRLLLGYAMPGEDLLFQGIAPYGHIEGGDARILGRFLAFVDRLFDALERLSGTHSAGHWAQRLEEILDAFFERSEETEPEFGLLTEMLTLLSRAADRAGFAEPMAFEAVHDWLERRLESRSFGSGFISGGVTFCAMVPMRSIPFKIVCLIGMNSGAFPRQSRRLGFDRMAAAPRPGDRNRRDDDKYLFLEALISARDRLYISYVGRSIQDNTPLPPSVLVSELVDTLVEDYGVDDAALITRHPLQAFSPAYFQEGGGLISYSTENRQAAESLLGARSPRSFFDKPVLLDEAEASYWRTPSLDMLCDFYAHPARFLLRRRLTIHLEADAAPADDSEAFALDGLRSYWIGQELVAQALQGRAPASRYELARARGALPHGSPGEVDFRRIAAAARAFAEAAQGLDLGSAREPETVRFELAGFSIRGRLSGLHRRGLLQLRFGKMRSVDLVQGWIRHLLLCSMPSCPVDRRTMLLFADGGVRFDPVEDAASRIGELLGCYEAGLQRPVPFFPSTSEAYARSIIAGKASLQAVAVARRRWQSDFGYSESDDPYYRCCFGDRDPLDAEFCSIAETVWLPLLACAATLPG